VVCKQCGWDNEQGARYCAGCGAQLPAEGSVAPAPPPAPRAPTSSVLPAGRGLRWWVLGGVALVLAAAGVIVGLTVLYPAREAGKIRASYQDMAAQLAGGNWDPVLATTTGQAKSDLETLLPVAALLRGQSGWKASCTVDVKDVKVRGRKATATVDVSIEVTGAVNLGMFGTQDVRQQHQATETHEWRREDGGWKLASWGAEGGIAKLAAEVAPRRALLEGLTRGK
jgi:hypothetical protein